MQDLFFRRLPCLLSCLLLTLTLVSPSFADEEGDERAAYIRANYAKFEYQVPMRDGVKLFTSVYVPNDPHGPKNADGKLPILLFRTPYSVRPYGADLYKETLGPNPEFEQEKFIFAFQDVRGRNMSEGEFVNMRPHRAVKKGPEDIDESSDTYDTIEWLLEHVDGNNGRVGQWGISYPGFYSAAGMIDSHPALKAVSPQAPIADWFWDDMHHHGAFILPLAFNFFSTFGQARPEPTSQRAEPFEHGTPDGYQFFLDLGPLSNANERYFKGEIDFWNEIVAHPNYDNFWQSRNLLPHLRNISAAVMVVGGWYDTEDLYGPLNIYRQVEANNPQAYNVLVMGPWSHGGWQRTSGRELGMADFGFDTSDFFQQRLLQFFNHFLKESGPLTLPEAWVFETGANRWRSFDAWPPAAAKEKSLYLHGDGKLALDTPPSAELTASSSYPSDPAKPVPYTMEITNRWAKKYMTEDQRFAAWRPDVLVFRSDILEQDVTLSGAVMAELFVSTTGTDADWIVKLVDEHPGEIPGFEEEAKKNEEAVDLGGYQMLVRGEVMRGRFRNSYETPEPFVSGQVTAVDFELHDILHTFKRGHRIMVQIQSTWFPFVDRNPQKYVPNIFEARPEDFVPATQTVHHSPQHPSRLTVKILP